MKKLTMIESGSNPEIVRLHCIPYARTKLALKIATKTKLKMDGRDMVGDTPIMTIFLDNMITNVAEDNSAEKISTIYKIDVEDLIYLKPEDLAEIKENTNKLVGLKKTTKINSLGEDVESSYNIDINELNKDAYGVLSTIDLCIEKVKTCLPEMPIGPGAIWIEQQVRHDFYLNLHYDLLTVFKFIEKSGSNLIFELMTKVSSSKEQLKASKNDDGDVIKYSGYCCSNVSLNLDSGEAECVLDGAINMATSKDDKELSSTQSFSFDMIYDY
jgi:hypothetical protein